MKFVKYNDNKSRHHPARRSDRLRGWTMMGSWKWPALDGAVILSRTEMTAMEMVRTILAADGPRRSADAGADGPLRQLRRAATEDALHLAAIADIEELIRPAVTVPDWAREEADIAPDAKLDCHVDEGSGVITVCETFYDHDLSDIPAELLEALRKSGCCLSVLEDMLMDERCHLR
ncbi:MAG: hypothetical protein ACLUS6_02600 [Dysosmobacter sp.]